MKYRLRLYPFRPGIRNHIDEGQWADDELFDTPEEAAQHRQSLKRPLRYRVVRDVDGEPQELTWDETTAVNGVKRRDELDKWIEEQKRRRRCDGPERSTGNAARHQCCRWQRQSGTTDAYLEGERVLVEAQRRVEGNR